MTDLVHIQSILDHCLPNDLELKAYRPIDRMAFHGSLHILVTKAELTQSVIESLLGSANVVDHSFAPSPIPRRTERSIILKLSSDVLSQDSHHTALAKVLNHLNSLNRQAVHPWCWWVQIAHLPYPLSTPFPSKHEYELYMKIIVPHANVASAGDLRSAALQGNLDFVNETSLAMSGFNAKSLMGRVSVLPILGQVPASVRIIGNALLVLHESVAELPQWLMVPDDFNGDAEEMLQDHVKQYTLATVTLGFNVRPGSAASTTLADIDQDTGKMSQALR